MRGNGGLTDVAPFPLEYRASGLLLHVTSLPSSYGIGDLGSSAFSWIDRLHDAGQKWWQVLPLGPTGYGDSPYQSLSSFALSPLLISPASVIAEGLLRASDTQSNFSNDLVDFDSVIAFKEGLLQTAWANFKSAQSKFKNLKFDYEQFCATQEHWLDDYALFRALKAMYHRAYYLDWPAELAQRKLDTLADAQHELADPIDQVRFAQFLLFRQAAQLKAYAHSKGVGLIGDLPFFVSPDSSDVWANPEFFLLDEQRRPRFVGGVPPDYFSAQGQLWGDPVYNWDAVRATGYRWCIDRLGALLAHVDVIRLDHFRGFAAAWHVPAGAPTAQSGQWVPGPGASFFQAVQTEVGHLPFIAEDLGLITPDVHSLRDEFDIPGTRVLQFAFDGRRDNPYLPDNFVHHTVAYTATHDNATTREWYEDLNEDQRHNVWSYLGRTAAESAEVAPALLRLAWSSAAALAIAPLQDLLNLGSEARMNVPGRADGNWRWRVREDMLSPRALQWLQDLTESCKRSVSPATSVSAQVDREGAPSFR